MEEMENRIRSSDFNKVAILNDHPAFHLGADVLTTDVLIEIDPSPLLML